MGEVAQVVLRGLSLGIGVIGYRGLHVDPALRRCDIQRLIVGASIHGSLSGRAGLAQDSAQSRVEGLHRDSLAGGPARGLAAQPFGVVGGGGAAGGLAQPGVEGREDLQAGVLGLSLDVVEGHRVEVVALDVLVVGARQGRIDDRGLLDGIGGTQADGGEELAGGEAGILGLERRGEVLGHGRALSRGQGEHEVGGGPIGADRGTLGGLQPVVGREIALHLGGLALDGGHQVVLGVADLGVTRARDHHGLTARGLGDEGLSVVTLVVLTVGAAVCVAVVSGGAPASGDVHGRSLPSLVPGPTTMFCNSGLSVGPRRSTVVPVLIDDNISVTVVVFVNGDVILGLVVLVMVAVTVVVLDDDLLDVIGVLPLLAVAVEVSAEGLLQGLDRRVLLGSQPPAGCSGAGHGVPPWWGVLELGVAFYLAVVLDKTVLVQTLGLLLAIEVLDATEVGS